MRLLLSYSSVRNLNLNVISDDATKSLVGGNIDLMGPLTRAMLRAGVLCGEYFEAQDSNGLAVGYLMGTPPGELLFTTLV